MKIFNKEKTKELNPDDIISGFGYFENDKLLIAHHDAVKAQEAIYMNREVLEESGGVSIYKDLISPEVEAKEAYDEYEDILIYIPYTTEELETHKLEEFRYKRKQLLDAFDKWEKAVLRGREDDDSFVMDWYYRLLDLDESALEEIPTRIKYYL